MILDNTNLNSYIHQIEVEVVNSYTTSLDVAQYRRAGWRLRPLMPLRHTSWRRPLLMG
jgi:hypothetical protein